MLQRKPLDAQASLLMLGICIVLGLQQVTLKLAADDISPLMQMALRSGLAALLVLPFIQLPKGVSLLNGADLKSGMILGFLFAAEFLLVAEALRYTSASHTVMLLYTSPIFTALGLHFKFIDERLSKVQWLGIFIAFIGVVICFMGPTHSAMPNMLWGDFLALMAGIFWSLTTIYLRLSRLAQAHPTQTLFYQLVGGFILLLPIAYLSGQAQVHWTLMAWSSLAFQTIIVSFLSLMIWFWLLRHYLASRIGVFSFLTPIFGMLFGVWFLGEQLENNFILGTAFVMLGIGVVSMRNLLFKQA